MKITEWEQFLQFDDILHMPTVMMNILTGDRTVRDDLFREAIRLHHGDLSYDWFIEIYMEELCKRKENKQEFTPPEVSALVSMIAGADHCSFHEPTAGTGGLLIHSWWEKARQCHPSLFKPSSFIVSCWELTERSIPFLLFNLAIRGIMGEVFHGDVLERTVKARYVLLNERDDALAFSEIVRDDNFTKHPTVECARPVSGKNIQPALFD